MLRRIKSNLLLVAIMALSACAVKKISINEIQSVNKVAVLSELDDQINKVRVGLTVFDSESTQSHMKSWNINHSIENDLAQKIWSTGKEVVILQSNTIDIMQERQKLVLNHPSYKGAQLVVIVKPIYQADNYPMFPEGYGIVEKNTLGIKQRILYVSILYEVYSTKDGLRKAYYIVHPEGENILKLDTTTSFNQLTEAKVLALKPEIFELFDRVDSSALKQMGLF